MRVTPRPGLRDVASARSFTGRRAREANVFIARTAAVFLLAATCAAVPRYASAQDQLPPGAISISVRDSLGRSIVGAELTVEGTAVRGVTDDKGELRFNAVRGGPATIRVRRLG